MRGGRPRGAKLWLLPSRPWSAFSADCGRQDLHGGPPSKHRNPNASALHPPRAVGTEGPGGTPDPSSASQKLGRETKQKGPRCAECSLAGRARDTSNIPASGFPESSSRPGWAAGRRLWAPTLLPAQGFVIAAVLVGSADFPPPTSHNRVPSGWPDSSSGPPPPLAPHPGSAGSRVFSCIKAETSEQEEVMHGKKGS